MLSAESSSVCQFIMTPDTQPASQSFNKHVNISSLTHSSRGTCHNIRIKLWLILPFLHLSSSDLTVNATALQSRKQMELCPPSDQKKKETREGSDPSVSLSASAALCSVSRGPKGAGEEAVTLLRKPFLKESGSWKESSWPSMCLRSEIKRRMEGRMKGHLRHSLSRPAFSDLVSYTRGFRAALSAANSRWRGCSQQQADDGAHHTAQFLSWMSNRPYLTTVTRYPSVLSMSST